MKLLEDKKNGQILKQSKYSSIKDKNIIPKYYIESDEKRGKGENEEFF